MDDIASTKSPVEAAARTVGIDTTDALKLLADETRLAILLALWEEHEPHADDAVPFSQLFERVDYDNRGNFSYHLEKLEGRFVTQHTERGGYELRTSGLKFVRSLIAGTGLDDISVTDAEIGEPCPICEAPTAVDYHDGVVLWTCTECDGVAPDVSEWGTLKDHMNGVLGFAQFEPAGVADRTPIELRAASAVAEHQRARSMFDGLCPTCSGRVDGRLEYCRDHDSSGVCDICGWMLRLFAQFQCRTCEEYVDIDTKQLALFHPAVVAFYENHEISTRFHADDPESARRLFDLMIDHEEELVSDDPLRIAVKVAVDDDIVSVTFDETASIVDVRR